jgi:hypothetical protein
MLKHNRSVAALAVAVALVPGLVACSEDMRLDVAGAETEIQKELATRFRVEPKSLTCPEEVTLEPGGTFQCEGVDRKGNDFTIDVELIGDQGKFTFTKPEFAKG